MSDLPEELTPIERAHWAELIARVDGQAEPDAEAA